MPNSTQPITDQSGPHQNANYNLVHRLHAYLTGVGFVTSNSYTGVGTGAPVLTSGTASTVTETWTLTCTATAVDGGTFSVVGSVSGAQANATVGVNYSNTYISFRIDDGATDFQVGDTFTVGVSTKLTAGLWETVRWSPSGAYEVILKSTGLSGLEEIYIGFMAYHDVTSDYYNITVAAFSGYTPGNSFDTQPGYTAMSMPTHNTDIPVWISWNAQRVIVSARVNTPAYVTLYAGKFFPYAMPSQYPYPVAVGSMFAANSATRYSATTYTMPYIGDRATFKIRAPAGAWIQPKCYPWSQDKLSDDEYIRDTNGQYALVPVVMYDSNGIYGELDGIYYVSGFNNLAENIAVIDGKAYVFLLNRNLTEFADYFAMRLD